MAMRCGIVLVFPAGVTKEEVEKVLDEVGIRAMAESELRWNPPVERNGQKFTNGYEQVVPQVREFDDDHGMPTWYIP